MEREGIRKKADRREEKRDVDGKRKAEARSCRSRRLRWVGHGHTSRGCNHWWAFDYQGYLSVCLSVSYVRSYISYKSAASERQHPQWALCCSLRHSHCFLLSLSLSLSLCACVFIHSPHSFAYLCSSHRWNVRSAVLQLPTSLALDNATPPMRLRQCLICMHRHSLAAPRGHRAAQCTPHLAHRWRDRVSSRFSSRW